MFTNLSGFHLQKLRGRFRNERIELVVLDSANVSGFRKIKWIPQTYADSAFNLRNPLTVCGFHLPFADYTYSCGFLDSFNLLNAYIIICLWIPQTVPESANFVADSAKLPVFGAFLSIYSVLVICPWNPKQQRTSKKSNNVADSQTNLILACCGICLPFTKCTVWPRNV